MSERLRLLLGVTHEFSKFTVWRTKDSLPLQVHRALLPRRDGFPAHTDA